MKKYILLTLAQIRSHIPLLPKFLICTFITALVAFGIGYVGNASMGKSSFASIQIAAAIPENDDHVSRGMTLLTSMDSINSTCEFILCDNETALEMVRNGEVAFAAIIPEGLVESIINGTNHPVTIVMPSSAGAESKFVSSVLDAGSHTLAYVQSGIYAMDALLIAHDLYDYVPSAEEALNNMYIKYALSRSEYFKTEDISLTGSVTAADFYICSGIALVLMFLGIAALTGYKIYTRSLDMTIKRFRILPFSYRMSELTAITLIIWIPLAVATAVYSGSLIMIPLSLLCVLLIMSLAMLTVSLFADYLPAGIILFLVSVTTMYLGGRIIPTSLLPAILRGDVISRIFSSLPGPVISRLYEGGLYGSALGTDIIIAAVYTALFIILTALVDLIRRRRYEA